MDYFRNERVLVTGGSSGIGLATARLLRRHGAHLLLVARDEAKLAKAKAELDAIASGAEPVRTLSLDLRDRAAVDAKLPGALVGFPVDVLLSNAGVVMPGHFLDLPDGQFDDMMQTNFLGPVHLVRAVLPGMIERKHGHVAFMSSFAGLIGIFGYTAYSASKFAIRGFAQALRCELKPLGVRVSVCYPPDTETPQLRFEDQYKPAETRAIAGNVKALSAEYVANALVCGMAAGQFQIVPGASARIQEWAYRMMPGIAHAMFDSDIRKAGAKR
jgi:3-dehydrosphinganine reductase